MIHPVRRRAGSTALHFVLMVLLLARRGCILSGPTHRLPFALRPGNTALIGATLLYEMLCVLPGVKYNDHPEGSP